jgi:hypothetical protein
VQKIAIAKELRKTEAAKFLNERFSGQASGYAAFIAGSQVEMASLLSLNLLNHV